VVKDPSQLRYVALYDQFRRGGLLFSDHNVDSEAIDVLKIDGRGMKSLNLEKIIIKKIILKKTEITRRCDSQ
jgi:hypothetical protein